MHFLLDQEFMKILDKMSRMVLQYTSHFMNLSIGIASILIFFVIAQESYNLMLGNKRFDPIWWLRPLLMLFIILTWQGGFMMSGGKFLPASLPGMVKHSFGYLEGSAQASFFSHLAGLEVKKKQKLELLSKKWDELLNKGAEVEAAKEVLKESDKEEKSSSGSILSVSTWTETLSKSFDSVVQSIVNYSKIILLQISTWVDKILEWLGNFVWTIAIYATFMTKELAIAFLTIFGPIHFALSIYDTWRDAWANWLMRFISFQFYGWVAYIIMTASLSLIDYGVQSDISVLSQKGFPEAFSFNALWTLAGYIVGAMAMKMVPEIVSWIVPTNASQAAGQFSAGLSSTFGTAPVKAGVSAVANTAGSAVSMIAGATVGATVKGAWDRTGGKAINESLDKRFGAPYQAPRPGNSSNSNSSSGSTTPKGNSPSSSSSTPPSSKPGNSK